MHCSQLHCTLNEFRRDGKYCDINIQVQDMTTMCHRVVLASVSEFFNIMFGSTFRENNRKEIVLHEIDPQAFECVLEFAYLGQEPNFFKPTNNVYDILKASDFLRVSNLVELCINHIIANISLMENVCEIFEFSCISNYPRLSVELSSYIAENFYLVSQREEFLVLSYEQLNTVMEKYQSLNNKYVGPSVLRDEDLLLDSIIRWISYKKQERKEHLLELLSFVNIKRVSNNFLDHLSKEYRVNLDGFIDLTLYLRAFFSMETRDAPPAIVYKNQSKNLALHVFVKFENLENQSDVRPSVLSVSKYHPKYHWSFLELEGCKEFSDHRVEMVALDKPNNYLYCLSPESPSFVAYPTISLNKKRILKAPFLNYSKWSAMCGFQNNSIYLYDYNYLPNVEDIIYYECEVDKWFIVPKMKISMFGAEIVADSKLVYLIGGTYKNTSFPQYVQAYDYRVPRWLELTKLEPGGSFDCTRCCYLNGKIYASDVEKMEVFDQDAGKWSLLSYNNHLPQNEQYGIYKMIPYENKIWIFYFVSDEDIVNLIIFDPHAITWLPFEAFCDLLASINENCEENYFSNQSIEQVDEYCFAYDSYSLNAVIFEPLDRNAVI